VSISAQEQISSIHPHRKLRNFALSKHCSCIVRVAALLFLAVLVVRPVAAEGPHQIQVTAKRFAFEPAEITVKKGEPVDLVLSSSDVPHGVRIRELNIDLHVQKGKTAEAKFTPQTVGTFVGHCSVFCGSGHGHMTLTIHVVD
jgi:cytochrome c oxidase subunit 2